MFAGHVGVALAIGRVERRANVGLFVAGALWLDAVLWVLVLLGWETAEIPKDFPTTHQPRFVFPFSHSLPAALLWSALAGALVFAGHAKQGRAKWSIAAWMSAAVASHWGLDLLVHRPEMSLTGASGHMAGLGLWDHMTTALALEAGLVVIGTGLFLFRSPASRTRNALLAGFSALLMILTAMGMTVAPPPPSSHAMAATSLASLALVTAVYFGLGKRSGRAPSSGQPATVQST